MENDVIAGRLAALEVLTMAALELLLQQCVRDPYNEELAEMRNTLHCAVLNRVEKLERPQQLPCMSYGQHLVEELIGKVARANTASALVAAQLIETWKRQKIVDGLKHPPPGGAE